MLSCISERKIVEVTDLTDDNMDFSVSRDDEYWTEPSADSWSAADMDGINDLIGQEAPGSDSADVADEAPVESRAARRAREEAERKKAARQPRAPKTARAVKPDKAAKPAKASKSHVAAKADPDSLPEDDPFWQLSSKGRRSAAPPEEPPMAEETGEDPQAAQKGRGKRDKAKKEKPQKEKSELSPEDAAKQADRKRRGRLTVIVFSVIFALLFVCATIGGYMVTASPQTLPNVYVGGVFAGNMTKEQVDQTLQDNKWDELVATKLKVKLPAEVSFDVDSCLSGAKLTREKAVAAVCSYGHSGNWYSNLYKYLMNYLAPADVELDNRHIDKDYVTGQITEGVKALEKATSDTGYTVDEKKKALVMLKGAGEITLDEPALYTAVETALLSDTEELSFSQLVGTLTMPDFQKLHDELAVEPADASFTESFEIVDEVKGCWFEVAEAEEVWKDGTPAELIYIPLELTYPEIGAADLAAMLYRDKLGFQTTYFTGSTENRISNIGLAAGRINDTILMPGEEFSYNETVGQRTEEEGFLSAGAYDNGEVVQEIGGGICQVSSTLYCAMMFAQLETVSRTNHYFKVNYLDYGLDATVSWPKPDFKFRNSREYPVKIVAYTDPDEMSLTVEIWGTNVDGTYVELRHTSLVVTDPTYGVHTGYGVSAFRTVYDAEGNFLYEIEEPYGIYNLHAEDIDWPPEKYAADAAAESGEAVEG